MSLGRIANRMIDALPRSALYEIFFRSAKALGVRSYEVDGEYGPFCGPLYDQAVIKHYMQKRTWSPDLIAMLRQELRGGGTFYDIGANIGLVAVPVSREPGVKVTAFEPDPHNCALLRANVAMAEAANVMVIIAAVAERSGTMSFARNAWNSGDHHLSQSGDQQVQVVRLDDHPPTDGRFVVKIDTQGAEPLIFEGGKEVLNRADFVISEFSPQFMRRLGVVPDPIFEVAMRSFTKGTIIRLNKPASDIMPVREVVEHLRHAFRTIKSDEFLDFTLSK